MNAALRAAPACCRCVRSAPVRHTACVATARGDAGSTPSDDEAKRVRVAQNQLAVFETILEELAPHVTSRQLPGLLKEAVGQRKFNSSNRRLFRELAFTAIRFWPWIEAIRAQLPPPPPPDGSSAGTHTADLRLGLSCAFLAGDTAEVRAVRRVFPALGWPAVGGGSSESDAPEGAAESERDLGRTAALLQEAAGVSLPPPEALAGPSWFASAPHWPDAASAPTLRCMLSRPPVWIRLQTDDPAPVRRELESLGLSWEESAELPGAWRVYSAASAGTDLTETKAFASGAIEVQDLGSQMILGAAAVRAGGRWLDACAGAGGKTLQLARLLGPTGSIDAIDVRQSALDELRRRAKRAGLAGRVRTSVEDSSGAGAASSSLRGQYDGVLVDAPCTGSGTWRRSPHLRWQLQEAEVAAMAERQGSILRAQAGRVRPGGVLAYATCSLSHAENGAVVESFLASEQGRDFAPLPLGTTFGFAPPGAHAMTVLPPRYDTDGFFVAQLQRKK